MERLEFIERIFTLYRVNPENNRELVLIYDDALSTRKPVDWDKLYKSVISTADGGLPKPGFFTAKFDTCLKDVNYTTADGIRLKVSLNDGFSYEYETYRTSLTFEQIKQKFMKLFGANFRSLALFDDVKLQWVKI